MKETLELHKILEGIKGGTNGAVPAVKGQLRTPAKCSGCASPALDYIRFGALILCLRCCGYIGYQFKNKVKEVRLRDNPQEYYETPLSALEGLGVLLNQTSLRRLLPPGSKVLEPTDGNGVIGNFLRTRGYTVFSFDKHPRLAGVQQADFLQLNGHCGAVVFNPPFNEFKKNQKWMKKAFEMAPLVIALLPDKFERNRAVFKRFKDKLHAILFIEKRLTFTTLPGCGKDVVMDCRWYVWNRDMEPGTRLTTINFQG